MNKRLIPATLIGLFSCVKFNEFFELSELFVLSSVPSIDFSDIESDNFGLVKFKIGAVDKSGLPLSEALDLIEIRSPGSPITVETVKYIGGYSQGDLLILVDGSGSLEIGGCSSCPTDPLRKRVDAVIELSSSLHECASDWGVALMDFGPRSSSGFEVSSVLMPYTVQTSAIHEVADDLISDGGTPLWDSLMETMDDLAIQVDSDLSFISDDEGNPLPPKDFGLGLVVITDGEDTTSSYNRDTVIEKAQRLQLPVSVIALGEASDLILSSSEQAILDLRLLTDQTGGFYATVSSAMDLPILSDYIAKAYCGGHTEILARFENPPLVDTQVEGKLWLKGTNLSTPFSFRSPEH